MLKPDFSEYEELSKMFNLVPVYREIFVDMETPISVYKKVCQGENTYLLESVEGGENLARYSFIGFDPYITYKCKNGHGIIREDNIETTLDMDPIKAMECIMSKFKAPHLEELPRFYGGAVGYFGYDMVRYIEDLPEIAEDDLDLPDCFFLITRIVLIFDHVKHTLKIVVNTRPGDNVRSVYNQAVAQIEKTIHKINQGQAKGYGKPKLSCHDLKSNMAKDEYMKKVEKAKEYIGSGDIFQVVPSQRFSASFDGAPFDIYRILRNVNPAPYLYYLNFGGTLLIGSSPEMLVRYEDGVVTTRPIAGTRPRGKDALEDLVLEKELLADEKERAEHLMLVDLGRNDLGRVSKYGTVKVTQFMGIEKYSHVMHIVSNIQGELQEKANPFDLLRATFPAGTLSGAPKIRAMQIIEELEPTRRGVYGGAIGYFGFTGNVDTCIIIRTILVQDQKIYIQAGAGIVADSDPETEYYETLNKARALLNTIQTGEVSLL